MICHCQKMHVTDKKLSDFIRRFFSLVGIPEPTGVQARRISSAIEMTWNAPQSVNQGFIAGYRVHYNAVNSAAAASVPADAGGWRTQDTGPTTVTEVIPLLVVRTQDPHN